MQKDTYLEMFRHEDQHWWFKGRRAIIRKVLDSCLPSGKSARILDAGCGTGGNLELLSGYGSLSAFEMDDKARDLANSRRICEVRKGQLPAGIPFTEKFDLICLLDVLEHIDDDAATLRSLRAHLHPHGKLLLTVPAWKFLWSAHDVVLNHKRRYSKTELLHLIKTSGLQLHYCTWFNTIMFPAIAVVRLVGRLIRRRDKSDISMPPAIVNLILTGLFASERVVMPALSLPTGVSLLLLVENPG